MTAIIEVDDLTKYYGKNRGVEDLTFSVEHGEVFGFLGPNGSGKTTTIRCLLGMLRPTEGGATIFGEKVTLDGSRLRSRIGYIPGEVHLYEKETGRWLMDYVSGFRGGRGSLEAELVERLEFDPSRKIKELSKGNKQKLALILGLMHDPELLILDEPTSGLDPLNQETVFDIIREHVEAGTTVFFSSHILSEVERVCDRVGIVREGRLVALEDVKGLLAQRTRDLTATFAEPVEEGLLSGVPGVRDVERIGETVLFARVERSAVDAVMKRLATRTLSDIEFEQKSLESVFLEFYRDEIPQDATQDATEEDATGKGGKPS